MDEKITFLSRMDDILNHIGVTEAIKTYMKIEKTGKASVIKASSFLKELFLDIHFECDTLNNAMKKINGGEVDIGDVIEFLEEEKRIGEIEFLSIIRDESNGILKGLIWTFKGSKEVCNLCGDLIFWDSTHNLTVYDYKLSSF